MCYICHDLVLLSQESFSVFAAHSVWNSEEVKKVVPGAFAFTILRWVRQLSSSCVVEVNSKWVYSCRDPVDAFESWYGYTRRCSSKFSPILNSCFSDLLPEIWLLGWTSVNLLRHTQLAGPTLLVVVIGEPIKSFFFAQSFFIPRQLIDLGINMKGSEDEISLNKKLDALEQQFNQVQQFKCLTSNHIFGMHKRMRQHA